MPHPLVEQLRFARSEFRRGFSGITDAEARRRFLPMNSISWNIGHLAWQEQRYWLSKSEGGVLLPEVDLNYANGAPASTPPLDSVLAAWEKITRASDPLIDNLTPAAVRGWTGDAGKPGSRILGSLLLRMIYHYWYHNGENLAIRQLLGHTDLPQFVGALDSEAPYRTESA